MRGSGVKQLRKGSAVKTFCCFSSKAKATISVRVGTGPANVGCKGVLSGPHKKCFLDTFFHFEKGVECGLRVFFDAFHHDVVASHRGSW